MTTHNWSRDVDVEHLAAARQLADSLGSALPLHLVLEVVAYADDEAAATDRRGTVTITVRADEVEIADDGRGTDTRRDESGRPIRKPVMATRVDVARLLALVRKFTHVAVHVVGPEERVAETSQQQPYV